MLERDIFIEIVVLNCCNVNVELFYVYLWFLYEFYKVYLFIFIEFINIYGWNFMVKLIKVNDLFDFVCYCI